VQMSTHTKTCYQTAKDMESVINNENEKP
jgi:hypothetical protein